MERLPLKSIIIRTADESLPHALYSSGNEATTALRVLAQQCVCPVVHVFVSESQRDKAEQRGDVRRLQTSDQMPGRKLQLGS